MVTYKDIGMSKTHKYNRHVGNVSQFEAMSSQPPNKPYVLASKQAVTIHSNTINIRDVGFMLGETIS